MREEKRLKFSSTKEKYLLFKFIHQNKLFLLKIVTSLNKILLNLSYKIYSLIFLLIIFLV